MARIALITPEPAGHVFSIIPLCSELMRRGHEVTLLTRKAGKPLAEAAGINVRLIPDNPEIVAPIYHLTWVAATCVGAGWAISMLSGFVKSVRLILTEVPPILRELKADVLIGDSTLPGARTAAERVGIPFITLNSALMWNLEPTVPPHTGGWTYSTGSAAVLRNRAGIVWWETYMGAVIREINQFRGRWKLPLIHHSHDFLSPYAQISQILAEVDYPRRELPEVSHYVGSMAIARSSGEETFPWDKLDGRPLIFASIGTMRTRGATKAFHAIASACEGIDAQLLITLGKWSDDAGNPLDELGTLAGKPLVMEFVPQVALLKRTALLITHAGTNTVMEAIREAVPMVALPRGVDQPAMAARVEYRGLGLRDSFHHPRPAILRQKIERVLTEPSFKQRCLQMQQAAVKAGGVVRAGDIVERVLATGKPVTRDDLQRLAAEALPDAAAAGT